MVVFEVTFVASGEEAIAKIVLSLLKALVVGGGIGRLLALTSNDAVNTLAMQLLAHLFSRANLYKVAPKSDGDRRKASDNLPASLPERFLGTKELTFATLDAAFTAGAQFKATTLTDDFDFQSYKAFYGGQAIPLFLINKQGELQVVTNGMKISPATGTVVISLVRSAAAKRDAGAVCEKQSTISPDEEEHTAVLP